MRVFKAIAVTAVIAAASTAGATSAGAATTQSAAAAARQFEGTVVSVNRANRTFRLRDSERGTVRITVNSRTRFERINGLRGLRKGMRRIEATVRASRGVWLALEVERSGGGGEHGGNGGDDHGGRGRGSDD
jgi:shikimate kinase